MISANTIGWISNVFFLYGVWAVARKHISGFYCNLLGNLLYVIVALMVNAPSLLWLSIGLSGLNIYGIYKWSKSDKKV